MIDPLKTVPKVESFVWCFSELNIEVVFQKVQVNNECDHRQL